jgi:Domain of unknown function (DUF1707)/Cell wall-active antibiotics response 4TMS YvqF
MSSLELDRERVIQSLCSHYANDNLTTQELEARFERAYQAATHADLRAVVANLPALPTEPEPVGAEPLYRVAPGGHVPNEKRSVAFMSNVQKTGEWIPARRNVVWAIMGSAEIDLREALIPEGVTEFHCLSLMAEVKLIVPPGVRVTCDGIAIMGEFKEHHPEDTERADAPTIRIDGTAVMGTVSIQTRLPGETRLEAWRRRRLQRRRS